MIRDARERFDALDNHARGVEDLRACGAILLWDQQLQMPRAGSSGRPRHLEAIRKARHERITDPVLGALLDDPTPLENEFAEGSDEAALVRVVRRQYERLTNIPMDFIARYSENASASAQAYRQALEEDDFSIVSPYLERTLENSREFASYFEGVEHVADPLIAEIDPGVTVGSLRPLFSELRARLVPLASAIREQTADAPALPWHENGDADAEAGLVREAAGHFGFDFERGRVDLSDSPFTIRFAADDVRFGCMFKAGDPGMALLSGMHESGHALYEQGVDKAYDGTLLGQGASDGIHESQARLWENIIGRGKPFWRFFYPRLQQTRPELAGMNVNEFVRAMNRVSASTIRTRADEVTYPLHIALRFELEVQLLEGKLAVDDLPEAWNTRMSEDLGIIPVSNGEGVLQDPHWYAFGFVGGSFQQYAIGSVLCAQFYDAALRAHPRIPAEIEAGEFSTLLGWLTENVYRPGAKFTADELVQRATGSEMSVDSLVEYLQQKYSAL